MITHEAGGDSQVLMTASRAADLRRRVGEEGEEISLRNKGRACQSWSKS
jgi:hypothetical protein